MATLLSTTTPPPPRTSKATGFLPEGHSVMRINDRVVMVDNEDFIPDGEEFVVLQHDGTFNIEVPFPVRIGTGARSFAGRYRVEGGRRCRYGVDVVGRVVREF